MAHGAEIFPMLLWNKNKDTKRTTSTSKTLSSNTNQDVENRNEDAVQQQRRRRQEQVVAEGGEDREELDAKPIPKIFGFGIHPQATIRYPML